MPTRPTIRRNPLSNLALRRTWTCNNPGMRIGADFPSNLIIGSFCLVRVALSRMGHPARKAASGPDAARRSGSDEFTIRDDRESRLTLPIIRPFCREVRVHHFGVELTAPNEWGVRKALLRVDGIPFLDIIREIEVPIAAESGEPDLAGQYDYLNSLSVLPPSRHLLGEAARPLLKYGEKVSVLECDCGCAGCWPLLMRIDVVEDQVIWSEPQQWHRDNWVYPLGELVSIQLGPHRHSLSPTPCKRRCGVRPLIGSVLEW